MASLVGWVRCATTTHFLFIDAVWAHRNPTAEFEICVKVLGYGARLPLAEMINLAGNVHLTQPPR
jgi:hypothetical protein